MPWEPRAKLLNAPGPLIRGMILIGCWAACAGGIGPAGSVLAQNDRPAASDEDPVAAELRFNQAVVRHLHGDHQAALEQLGSAGRETVAAAYYRGLLLLQSGEVGEADRVLTAIASEADTPAELPLYLGMARLHAGDAVGAEAVLRPYAEDHPRHAYSRYLFGVSLAHQKRAEEAAVHLQAAGIDERELAALRTASHAQPLSSTDAFFAQDAARASISDDDWSAPVRSRSGAARPWNFTLLLANEYDSNIPLAPTFTGLGSDIERSDWRAIIAAFGDFRVVEQPGWNAGVIGSVFSSFHYDLGQFDLQNYMGGTYTNVALGDFMGGVRYEFHETRMGNRHLASDHRLTPNLTYMGCDWGHTTVYYEYNTAILNAPVLIPAHIQSGDVHAVGATQAVYTFGGQGRVYIGYRFENASTVGDDFDRQSNMVTARIEQPIGNGGWIWDAEVRHFWDDYKHPNSLDFFDRPRRDRRLEVRSGLQKNFLADWALRLDYTHVTTSSNVENLFGVRFFEYDRHIFSTQLIFDF